MELVEITKVLPHQYPFILVDRIQQVEHMKSAKGYKNISHNEPWVVGHFPGNALYPGVLMIETLAQVSGFILYNEKQDRPIEIHLCAVNNMKFVLPLRPGDVLSVEAELIESAFHFHKIQCTGKVGEQMVVSGVLTLSTSV